MKHADAKQVSISLRCSAVDVLLQISDDGKGCDLGKIRKGLGLDGIANRAELFGGTTEIISFPGKGCQVHVSLTASFTPVISE
jgi:signal transduction histidine kinase